MLDFTSALYLGMEHQGARVPAWCSLTTGRPAALQTPPGADLVTSGFARLLGCEAATLGTSTLHIFFDLFEVLPGAPIGICLERGSYPIARWGVERMAAIGVPVGNFRSGDIASLERLLKQMWRRGCRPVVVADGLDPASGRPAPLDRYLALVRHWRGWLVVDDTQALGILGRDPVSYPPYGRGGGGSAAWHGLRARELVVVGSLAKGFGVPLALLAGSSALVESYVQNSTTRVHCSAPSAAHIAAARQALVSNLRRGEQRRLRLLQLIRYFRRCLQARGIRVKGGFFPVQTPILGAAAAAIHQALSAAGIATVLHRGRAGAPAQLSFLLTAQHQVVDIERATTSLAKIVNHRIDTIIA